MGKLVIISVSVLLLLFFVFTAFTGTFQKEEKPHEPFVSEVKHPEWTKDAVIYEINIRQFSPGGDFKGVQDRLAALKELGVDILWFMPIHPIGEKNRKGELGSYYSVKDYWEVNPEFGTMDEFRQLLETAGGMGFHTIIDWVPNHTAWDNPLLKTHPGWYQKDSTGKYISPYDWTDVVQLDWNNTELQEYMLESLKFWVKMGVEGFRVDHPHKTPYEFWENARGELEKIRPVFMLAENEDQTRFLEKGFDMNYSWELHHLMNSVAQRHVRVTGIDRFLEKEHTVYPRDVYRMRFIDNHDENSWAGTINERMGEAQEAFAVFMFTIPGFPLLYNGQEACLDKRLQFFTRDPIEWKECDKFEFYSSLIRLKKENPALWNGEAGAPFHRISTGKDRKVFAFYRGNDTGRVVVFLNLTRKSLRIKPDLTSLKGNYMEYFSGESLHFPLGASLRLEPWGYRVYILTD